MAPLLVQQASVFPDVIRQSPSRIGRFPPPIESPAARTAKSPSPRATAIGSRTISASGESSVGAPEAPAAARRSMTYEGVHRLPVVSDDDVVLGILSSLDVLRWFGRRCGYLIPPARKRA